MSENKPNIFQKTGKFAVDVRSELKRVVWPTWAHVAKNTLTVLVLCLIFGIIIWTADTLFYYISGLVYGAKLVA